jgi:hypothetical protein
LLALCGAIKYDKNGLGKPPIGQVYNGELLLYREDIFQELLLPKEYVLECIH